MPYPPFYGLAPRIVMYDPLAEFLGAADDGLIEYTYLDAVKLAGHSCPTVAGAYLMTLKSLARLYPDSAPERGAVRVEVRDDQAHGVAGVIGNVAALITGAAQQGGFKGIAGRFDRRDLIRFGTGGTAELVFRREDDDAAVAAHYHPEIVPLPERARTLLQQIVQGHAGAGERKEFAGLWQARVRSLLVDHADDPRLIQLEDL